MKLRAIRLHNVRRFTDRGISIENINDGVNVLAAANEFGKSTIFDAVHALFFQGHKGRAGPIKLLQPYSKGPVTVEVDIETGDGIFRLRKRWMSSARSQVFDTSSNRLVAQADEADQWINAKIRGGATGPAGLLWVQQGIVEMGRARGAAAETEKSAREDVLTSVAGEIEVLTGGRRTTQVLAKCQADLDALITGTGKARKGGAYAAALEEFDSLEAQAEDLTKRVGDLRNDLDRRATERKRLAELQAPEALANDSKALEEADTALKIAEAQVGELDRATLSENLARQEREGAKEKLERFKSARASVDDLQKAIVEEETAREKIASAHTKAKADEGKATAAVRECRDKLLRAEANLVAANDALQARDAVQRLEACKKTFADADVANRTAETAQAKVNALTLPTAKIDALKKLDVRIETLKAEMRASSMSVRADYLNPDGGVIRANGSTLTDGIEVAVERATQFEIEGIGTLTISPGIGDRTVDLDRELSAISEQRTMILSELGVPSLAAVHAQQVVVAEHVGEIERSKARRDALAPEGLDVLRAEVERLSAKVIDAPTDAKTVEECTLQRDAARQSRNEAEDMAASASAAFAERDRKLTVAETNLRHSKERLSRVTAELGDGVDLGAEEKLLTEAFAKKSNTFDQAHRAAETLRQSTPDLANLKAVQKRAASVVERTREEAQKLTGAIRELNGSIGARANEGIEEELAATLGHQDRAKQRVGEIETEVATLRRLYDVLTDAKAEAKEHFFEPVVQELKPLLGIVFGDAKVTFSEETLLPTAVERGGDVESFDVLSGGMREQITVLTRLAFARLLARDGRTVPVILDDALIYADDERIERMFDALHRQAEDLQILVFTCRQRAFQRLGGQTLSMQEWTPEA